MDHPLAYAGTAALALAALAWIKDWRRRHRKDLDAVGVVDWTTVFFLAFLAGVLLLIVAAKV